VNAARVAVTVVWATPAVQDVVAVSLAPGATVADAVAASGLIERHSIDRRALRTAVFGRLVDGAVALRAGDRVELLRPLAVDPKEARRLRAAARPRASGRRP